MAFQNKNLSVIAYANGFTLWHYATGEDKMTDVVAAGYFASVKTLMNVGDIVIVNASDSAGIKQIKISDGTISCAAIS